MFVRIKKIGGRRYAYLAEGVRVGGRVRQRTLCYLGPLVEVAFGVSEERRRKPELTARPDWSLVNAKLRAIPLTFDELGRARARRYLDAVKGRRQGFLSGGTRERVEGEPDALAAMSRAKFGSMFRKVGERRYSMA